jgi:hypothetical protein
MDWTTVFTSSNLVSRLSRQPAQCRAADCLARPRADHLVPGKICVAREVGKMHDSHDSVEMINGVPVVSAPVRAGG